MNFSAFGGPFSGIHQFAAKFGHDSQNGPFASGSSSMNTQEVHGNRYHANGNQFNQNSTSSKTSNSCLQFNRENYGEKFKKNKNGGICVEIWMEKQLLFVCVCVERLCT